MLAENPKQGQPWSLSGCNKVTVQGDINVGKSTLDISH